MDRVELVFVKIALIFLDNVERNVSFMGEGANVFDVFRDSVIIIQSRALCGEKSSS